MQVVHNLKLSILSIYKMISWPPFPGTKHWQPISVQEENGSQPSVFQYIETVSSLVFQWPDRWIWSSILARRQWRPQRCRERNLCIPRQLHRRRLLLSPTAYHAGIEPGPDSLAIRSNDTNGSSHASIYSCDSDIQRLFALMWMRGGLNLLGRQMRGQDKSRIVRYISM